MTNNKHTLTNSSKLNSDSTRLNRDRVVVDKLTIEESIWGELATKSLLAEEMLGAEIFTDALIKIANSDG